LSSHHGRPNHFLCDKRPTRTRGGKSAPRREKETPINRVQGKRAAIGDHKAGITIVGADTTRARKGGQREGSV